MRVLTFGILVDATQMTHNGDDQMDGNANDHGIRQAIGYTIGNVSDQ